MTCEVLKKQKKIIVPIEFYRCITAKHKLTFGVTYDGIDEM